MDLKMKTLVLLALVLFASSGTLSALVSYDQDCATTGCVSPLVCSTFTKGGATISRCTQPNAVCTIMPQAWVNPLSGMTSGNNTSGPVKYIEMLENGTGRIMNNTSGFYQAGWFSDWRLSSITGVAIAIIIIAVAAMIGHAFSLPEVKAFVDAELMQAVVSVLLVVSLIGLVAFFDEVARLAIEAGNLPVRCDPNEPCYISTAKQYLDGIYDSGKEYAKTSLQNSFDRQNLASAGYSVQFNVWWLAFGGTNMRPNAGESIQAERTSAIFDTTTKLLAGIYAQKYFIEVISFGIAPIFLLFGALLRTFFFTRKLGGLMLAIAVSLFVVYPLTFAFAWYTLNVTVYGDRVLSVSDPACPSECTATYPVAFYINSTGDIRQFRTTQEILRAGIDRSNWASGGPDLNGDSAGDYPGLVACRNLSKAGIGIGPGDSSWGNCENCPDYCRDVPFPSTLPGCDIAKCSYCNAGCKIMRQRYDCPQKCPNCPADCKLRQPVENKCYYPEGSSAPVPADLGAVCGGCEGCPSWCKVLYDDGTKKVLINKDEGPCQVDACKPTSQPGGTCPDKCMYVSTLSSADTNCNQICTDTSGAVCPSYCRLMDPAAIADYNTTNITGCNIPACSNACRSLCGINITGRDTQALNPGYLDNCAPFPKISATYPYCTGCPDYCRFQDYLNYTAYGSNTKLLTIGNETVRVDTTVPLSCSTNEIKELDCNSAACDGSCKAASTPALCREYDASAGVDGFCTKCPSEARIALVHTSKAGTTDYSGPPALSSAVKCTDTNCAGVCKSGTLPVTTEASNPACKDYNPSSATTIQQCHTEQQCECVDVKIDFSQKKTGIGFAGSGAGSIRFVDEGSKGTCSGSVSQSCSDLMDLSQCTSVGCSIVGQTCSVRSGGNCNGHPYTYYCTGADGQPDYCNYRSASECGNWQCTSGCYGCELVGGDCSGSVTATCENIGNENTCTALGCTWEAGAGCPAGQELKCNDVQVCKDVQVDDFSSCQRCPISCRVSFTDPAWQDSALCTAQACGEASCTSACKPAAPSTAPICHEYLGAGPGADVSATPIDSRSSPYSERGSCKQCPENCRVKYSDGSAYEGSCGLGISNTEGVTKNVYVDCSEASCPDVCRETVQKPTEGAGVCQKFAISDKPCGSCSAFCRRSEIVIAPLTLKQADKPSAIPQEEWDAGGYCPTTYCGAFDPTTQLGCSEECRFPDPPSIACEGCVECPTDCLYTPPTRTDCSEVCTEEALAGPINVGPGDFIKKLPGAQGEVDVKNVGVLMIPALVLPLFCLVMVVSFIRVLSPILGGDIEIPGLGRII